MIGIRAVAPIRKDADFRQVFMRVNTCKALKNRIGLNRSQIRTPEGKRNTSFLRGRRASFVLGCSNTGGQQDEHRKTDACVFPFSRQLACHQLVSGSKESERATGQDHSGDQKGSMETSYTTPKIIDPLVCCQSIGSQTSHRKPGQENARSRWGIVEHPRLQMESHRTA